MDFSGFEFLVIIAVIILVVGPQDIPKIMLTLGRVVRRVQYIKYAFSQQFEDFLREHDLQELRNNVNFEASDDEPIDEAAGDEADFADAALVPEREEEEEPEQETDRAAG